MEIKQKKIQIHAMLVYITMNILWANVGSYGKNSYLFLVEM